MKRAGLPLAILAMLMVIAHACVPHRHHQEMSRPQHWAAHQFATGLLGQMETGFHHDAGNDLDSYRTVPEQTHRQKPQQPGKEWQGCVPNQLLTVHVRRSAFNDSYPASWIGRQQFHAIGLRAPPTHPYLSI
ncbi:MAG: hypothetical protein K9J06_07935 [Flavobacteriales bacterium]|nr:hypothetical protein [Flavobacteriales bacterium]